MKKASFIIALAAIFCTTSCVSSFKSTADYDKKTDFTKYKTFSLLPWNPLKSSDIAESSRALVFASAKKEMESRGYTHVESGGDLTLGFSVLIEENIEYRTDGGVNYNVGYGLYGYYGTYGMGYSGNPSSSRVYFNDGAIFVDVFDEKQKTLIWQGSGFDRLEDNPHKNEQKIPEYMKRIFYKFPVKAKRS